MLLGLMPCAYMYGCVLFMVLTASRFELRRGVSISIKEAGTASGKSWQQRELRVCFEACLPICSEALVALFFLWVMMKLGHFYQVLFLEITILKN